MMKKIILSMFIFMFTLTLVNADEWYDTESTLADATMQQWSKGSNEDKLVTCGDWVSGIYIKKKFNQKLMALINLKDMDGIKEIAQGCVQMLDAATGPETSTQKAAELFVLGAMLDGWIEM